eukprot:TRINITY_DN24194_c0_g1_i1.p1 TRINITY_DN24194_c0_g1~~TRINITY_DN24194_c0_g1_i1.p1  ORF type:complete len:624 (-),score=114.99 TRINITY_DN24194_c0_g1_i1:125-1960(-)
MSGRVDKGSDPLATDVAGADAENLASWLRGRLENERKQLLRHSEERHAELVREALKACPRWCGVSPCSPGTLNSSFTCTALVHHSQADSQATASERCDDISECVPLSATPARHAGDPPAKQAWDASPVVPGEPAELGASRHAGDPAVKQAWDASPVVPCEPAELGTPRSSMDTFRRAMSTKIAPSTVWGSSASGGEQRFAAVVVRSKWFEVASAGVILLNIVVSALEAQYKGMANGYENNFPGYELPAHEAWPGAMTALQVLDITFMIIFTIELLFRFACHGMDSIRNLWIAFDTLLVSLSLLHVSGLIKFNASLLRVLRLLRIVRLLKMFRMLSGFDTLFLLVRSLQASVGALFWSFVILFMLQVAVGLLLGQFLDEFIVDKAAFDFDTRLKAFSYFGTFSKTILTMAEITFANWVPVCRFLVESVGESFALFFIFYRCMVCFAVVRVIAAVFVAETNRIAAADGDLLIRRKEKFKVEQLQKIRNMFMQLDANGNGVLSATEFQSLVEDPKFKPVVAALDVDKNDVMELFHALDGGDGEISVDEFVGGLLRIKGGSRGLDIVKLLTAVDKIQRQFDGGPASPEGRKRRKRISLNGKDLNSADLAEALAGV